MCNLSHLQALSAPAPSRILRYSQGVAQQLSASWTYENMCFSDSQDLSAKIWKIVPVGVGLAVHHGGQAPREAGVGQVLQHDGLA